MLSARTRLLFSRLCTVLSLAFFISFSTGCATRALMSSDRYEKPEPETQQFRLGDDISQNWQPGVLTLEESYLATLESDRKTKLSI